MIYDRYMLSKHFNVFYLPRNKVFYINFNRINEKHDWLTKAERALKYSYNYKGEVVIDYRNIKFDHSPRFVSVPFKEGSFNWNKAKPIEGTDVILEYIQIIGRYDIITMH